MKISIKNKFILGFIVIFSIAGLVLNYFIGKSIQKNVEGIMISDMAAIEKNTREYLKQFFVLNKIGADEKNFNIYGKRIAGVLCENTNCNIALYTNDGKFICQSTMEDVEIEINTDKIKRSDEAMGRDIKLAVEGKSGIYIPDKNEGYNIYFSYPLYIKGEKIGIVRFNKNYWALYSSNRRLLKMLTMFTAALFTAVFIFSYLLTIGITEPIKRLKGACRNIAMGNYNKELKIKNGDELEELAESFNYMRDKIKKQIETINLERERILELEEHRREFFNNVTHELKTPLTTIYGYAQIISEESFNDRDFEKRALDRIKSESQRLYKMVVDLIKLSKKNTNLDVQETEEIDLKKLVLSISEDMSLKADKYNIKITSDIEDINIMGNSNEIKEVFINVIDNAIKYGEANGEIKIYGGREGHFAFITVENKGKEIPKDKIDRVFEPFFRVDKNETKETGSSGLGLYICKTIVEKHNGEITITSERNITRLKIKIPFSGNNLATNK